MNFIQRWLFKHKLEAQLEAEKRCDDLCQQAAKSLVRAYGFRGTGYDILAEVEQICRDKDIRKG